jgi:RNA polymerase sigma factor (sigma-70 family)
MNHDDHDDSCSQHQARAGIPPETLQALVAGHREFVAFVARRIGDRAAAEDIVQDAFLRGLERGGELRQEESARAWFYRVLRNAIVDRHRRLGRSDRHLAALQDELERAERDRSEAADRELCACIHGLIDTLPPAQRDALRRIEIDGIAVKDFAREAGIGESAAGVRVFRARRALRERTTTACGTCAEHGCFDCSCGR